MASTAALIDTLQGVRTRVKWLGAAFGAGVVIAASVLLVLVVALVDYQLHLNAVLRFLVLIASIVGIGYAILRWTVRPILARLTISDVAGHLEQAFPQFDDRLRSTVAFSQGEIPGSDAMKTRVMSEASDMARQIDLTQAIVMRPVWYSLLAGISAVLLAVVLMLTLNPLYTRTALLRLLVPFTDNQWPKRYEIGMVGDVPARVPLGQRINLKMQLKKGTTSKAIVSYQYDNGAIQKQVMTLGEDGVFAAAIDARTDADKDTSQLRAWIEAGDDRKEVGPITIVQRLEIKGVEAAVTPPSYAQRAGATFDLTNGPATMTLGATVDLHVRFNKPLDPDKEITLRSINEEKVAPQGKWAIDGSMATLQFVAKESLRFRVTATDTDGFSNSGIEEYEYIVRPDQLPTVQIEKPHRNEERTPVAVVPLQGWAEDDYSIASLKLMVERIGDQKRWEIDLVKDANAASEDVIWNHIESIGDRQRFRANYQWDLAQLAGADLKPGDVLEYSLQVQDNFQFEGQFHAPVYSGKLRITIISQEELVSRVTEELRTVSTQVGELLKNQNRTKEETANLAKETEKKPALDEADKQAATRLANQQSGVASQSKQVVTKLDDVLQKMAENKSDAKELKDIAKDVKDVMNDAAENPMKDAANKLNEAKDAKGDNQKEQSEKALDAAQKQQANAADKLQNAMDRMGSIGTLQRTIDEIKDILDKQQKLGEEMEQIGKENLGKKPEEMKPEDKDKLDKLAADQQKLSEQTDKATANMEKTADQMKKSDPTASDAMKQAAQTSKQQQVSSNQSKASKSAKQNQQSQAQQAQKQAELGLEMILNQLREAEKRKLEELSKKLEELEKQIAILIRRQAGHNLDNLGLQGAARLAKVSAEQMDELLSQADRTKDALPPVPALPQLTAAQEQTERNTRDIAKSIEDLPSGAEPASHLTAAAGKMERAAVNLRENKLPDAYEPSQVEALAALLEAMKNVEDMKKEVDQKLEDKEKDSIRQAYIKVKEEQEKLNAEVVHIDGSERAADGALKREEAVRLNQLPGEQGTLQERIEKIGEDIASLGSVVYTWANKDIAKSMADVKDDLGKPTTGKPTQAEQARIVAQLDSMIKNLAQREKDKKFEDPKGVGGGGGGQGQGQVQLPPEAELRLLKDLQKAINDSTKIIDAQAQKDNQKLLALGNRQGEHRDLLDKLMQAATKGQVKLGPEPDNKDQLPEEAEVDKVEDQELDQELLTGEQTDEKIVKDTQLIGDRMSRSRQRLALNNDPGKITQVIQERILKNLDELIDMAHNQQQQQQQQQAQGKGQGQKRQQAKADGKGQPKNQGEKPQQQGQPGQPQPNNGQTPAQNSSPRQGGEPETDLAQDAVDRMKQWGGITPREREAVIEGAGEVVIEKYKGLTDDYYRSLATKATERE